jgi:hypothetical protein
VKNLDLLPASHLSPDLSGQSDLDDYNYGSEDFDDNFGNQASVSPEELNVSNSPHESDLSYGSADELVTPGLCSDDDDDWIYEEGSSTEEVDTEWDSKLDVDGTVGLDTIIDNVDGALDKEKLQSMSEHYTNPTIVAMFLLYTKHLISVNAYSDLVNILQQPWFDPSVLPRSLKGTYSA